MHDLHMQITSVVCTPFKIKRMCRNQSLWRIYLFFHRILSASFTYYTKYIQIYPNMTKWPLTTWQIKAHLMKCWLICLRFLFCCGNRPHGFFVASILKSSFLQSLHVFSTQILKNYGVRKPLQNLNPQEFFFPILATPPGFFSTTLGFSTTNNRPPETHCRSPHPLGLRNCTRYCGAPLRGARTYGARRWRLLRKISALEGPRVPSWERIHIFWIYSPPRMQSSQMKV